jgi:hypothetical protein
MIYDFRDNVVRIIEADGLHISLDGVDLLCPETKLRNYGEIDRSATYRQDFLLYHQTSEDRNSHSISCVQPTCPFDSEYCHS